MFFFVYIVTHTYKSYFETMSTKTVKRKYPFQSQSHSQDKESLLHETAARVKRARTQKAMRMIDVKCILAIDSSLSSSSTSTTIKNNNTGKKSKRIVLHVDDDDDDAHDDVKNETKEESKEEKSVNSELATPAATAAEINEIRIQFNGSTNTLYHISFTPDGAPACSCPDQSKSKQRRFASHKCKHLLYIILTACKMTDKQLVDATPQKIWQYVHAWYLRWKANINRSPLQDASPATASVVEGCVSVRTFAGDDCPICFVTMDATDTIWSCVLSPQSCGRSAHMECMEQWRKFNTNVTCVYCRISCKE